MVWSLRKAIWPWIISGIVCVTIFVQSASLGWGQASDGAGYPVPSDPNQIFFLQRSMNANTIVYAARIDSDGTLDRREPIEVFWRRFNDSGEKLPLTFTERNLAFGVNTKHLRNENGAYLVTLKAYAGRSAVLRVVNGAPRLEGKIAGQEARLISAFLHLDESGRIPRVIKVDLRGETLASGQPLIESFIP
ncbi:MAG: DUF4833 domain-containing protein [Hyphomicrobiales bacterium]|jgi:hypothetical protein|nr:DUF4833 domain-containing protein [Hyphomicrobiales bacterium]